MAWLIYKHTNLANGKVYIGQTCQRPEDRWLCGHGYPNNKHFDRAIKKYGWDLGFKHEILVENIPTLEEANKLEIYYIEKYHSYVKDPFCNGYNLTKGGDNRDNFGKIVLQIDDDFNVVNSYVSIGAAGRAIGDSHGTGVSACCRRRSRKCKGFYFAFADDYNSLWEPKEDEHNKPIICLDTGIKYEKISDYEKESGKTIRKYNGELHANGLKFVYVDEYDKNETQKYLQDKQKKLDSLKIVCFENNKEYDNVKEAIIDLRIEPQRISNLYKALNDSGYSVKGLHFVRKNEWFEGWKPREFKQHRHSIIVCFETKEEFKSGKEAATCKKASASEICKCCKDETGKYTAGGFHWCYKENLANFQIGKIELGKKVYCFETGQVYTNAEEASLILNVPAKSIRNCCKKIYNSSMNYHFCYEIDKDNYKIVNNHVARKVYCFELKRTFKSTQEAAKILGLSSGSIFNVCMRKPNCLSCGKLHFCFDDEKDTYKIQKSSIKKVLCLETEEIFNNCVEAGKAKSVNSCKIGMCCNGKRKTCGGYHWKYIDGNEK